MFLETPFICFFVPKNGGVVESRILKADLWLVCALLRSETQFIFQPASTECIVPSRRTMTCMILTGKLPTSLTESCSHHESVATRSLLTLSPFLPSTLLYFTLYYNLAVGMEAVREQPCPKARPDAAWANPCDPPREGRPCPRWLATAMHPLCHVLA